MAEKNWQSDGVIKELEKENRWLSLKAETLESKIFNWDKNF